LVVGTEELAKEVVDTLNKNPRKYGNLAFVDGCEHCKSFDWHKVLVNDPTLIASLVWSLEDAIGRCTDEESDDEDED
jgi:hypothetical protein